MDKQQRVTFTVKEIPEEKESEQPFLSSPATGQVRPSGTSGVGSISSVSAPYYNAVTPARPGPGPPYPAYAPYRPYPATRAGSYDSYSAPYANWVPMPPFPGYKPSSTDSPDDWSPDGGVVAPSTGPEPLPFGPYYEKYGLPHDLLPYPSPAGPAYGYPITLPGPSDTSRPNDNPGTKMPDVPANPAFVSAPSTELAPPPPPPPPPLPPRPLNTSRPNDSPGTRMPDVPANSAFESTSGSAAPIPPPPPPPPSGLPDVPLNGIFRTPMYGYYYDPSPPVPQEGASQPSSKPESATASSDPLLGVAPDGAAPTPARPTSHCTLLLCVYRKKDTKCRSFRLKVDRSWTDAQFFTEMRNAYFRQLGGRRVKWLSLRGLKAIIPLHYGPTTRPVRLLDSSALALQELWYAFRRPEQIGSQGEWVDWAFALKAQANNRYGLEFVEGWNGSKIAALGVTPLLGTLVASIAWARAGGDLQTVFTVTSYALAVCTGGLALVAILSQVGD